MSCADLSFGVLTLATKSDYLKAIGLSLSLSVSNPGVPRAVACREDLFPKLRPYFDYLVPEIPGLKGFAHKVYLDIYSPFEKTMFFDSDVLVFRCVKDCISNWPEQPYNACGVWSSDGVSSFGLDRAKAARRIGVERLVCIDGAGHALFDKSSSLAIFDRARFITNNYAEFGGGAKYADEDVLNIVMTEQGLVPVEEGSFFSRFYSARPFSIHMDASKGFCSFISRKSGQKVHPCMMHFAADEAPLFYAWQLFRIFRANGVSTGGLFSLGLTDYYLQHIKNPLSRRKAALLNRWAAH